MLMYGYIAKSVAKCELSAFAGSDLVMHCDPPPRPCLWGFRRPLVRTAEPDYSPPTLCRASSPARLLMSGDGFDVLGRGGGEVGCLFVIGWGRFGLAGSRDGL